MGMRKLSIILMVAGVVIAASGAAFNAYTLSKTYQVVGNCPPTSSPCESGIKLLDGYQRGINVARGVMVVGFAALITGVVIFRRIENKAYKAATKKKIIY